MTTVTIKRWSKNLAVCLPQEIVAATGLGAGEQVEIDLAGDGIVVRRAAPRFTLEELFRGRTPEEWRREYAGAYDWGDRD